ncbi:MAG: hypothetical protein R2750_13010 [Bacteroidales bacterium]
MIIIIIGITIIGFLAITYPALYLSRFKPIDILSKEYRWRKEKIYFGNVMVVFQFLIFQFSDFRNHPDISTA